MKKQLLLIIVMMMGLGAYAKAVNDPQVSAFQSTSIYAPSANANVSAPGAAIPAAMYSTTLDQSSSRSNIRRAAAAEYDDFGNLIEDQGQDEGSPIGSPLVLALLAAGYAVVRKRK